MKTIGITKMDMANVGSGAGFKEAADQKVAGTLQGIGTVETERLNEGTGELEPVLISIVKVNNQVYSGASKVVEGRIKNLMGIVGESKDVEDGKIDIAFENIKLAKGTGTNLIVTRYEE